MMEEDKTVMDVVCSWCKRVLHQKECAEHMEDRVSHTICEECLEKVFPEHKKLAERAD